MKPNKTSVEATFPFQKTLWKITGKMHKGVFTITVASVCGHADRAAELWSSFKEQLVAKIKSAFKQTLAAFKSVLLVGPTGVEESLSLA